MNKDHHTFVVCAYGESSFLEECIQSLQKQSVSSNIIMTTSTPNSFISLLSEKYQIPLFVNEGESGMVQDWNFGYSKANTKYVTLAHQDDVYFEKYTEEMLRLANRQSRGLIYFTDYVEIRNNNLQMSNTLLKVKRIMLLPLRFSFFWKSRFVRRRILSFGCPICCPSVTFFKKNLPKQIFKTGFRSDEDWEAWENLSRLKGSFIYSPKVLVGHRIHLESETSAVLNENVRTQEDYQMLCKFWPRWIAKRLAKFYAKSEESNEI